MLKITPIPVLEDNYIWVLQKEKWAVIFDPAEAQPVQDFLDKNKLVPVACLLTHNHRDHTDGVLDLVRHFPDLQVFGPEETRQFVHHLVEPNNEFELLGWRFDVIDSAGHTAGHISYLVDNQYLFCGDALFSGGCGRVFTENYQAQFDTLQRFKQLPDFVSVFPAHEYTQSNLNFAVTVMAPSQQLVDQIRRVNRLREQNRPTLPTTIGVEKQINPFMQADSVEILTILRKQKDQF